jgi:hypothetical protein
MVGENEPGEESAALAVRPTASGTGFGVTVTSALKRFHVLRLSPYWSARRQTGFTRLSPSPVACGWRLGGNSFACGLAARHLDLPPAWRAFLLPEIDRTLQGRNRRTSNSSTSFSVSQTFALEIESIIARFQPIRLEVLQAGCFDKLTRRC